VAEARGTETDDLEAVGAQSARTAGYTLEGAKQSKNLKKLPLIKPSLLPAAVPE